MKKVLLSLMALVVMAGFSTLQAKVVDRDEALEVAADFFRTHNIATLSTSEVREVWNSNQLSTVGVATLSATETPTLYVFVPETGKGFVIVSADDATPSVLGYSLDKEIAVGDDMPCNFRWWCEAMDKQIVQFRQTGTISVKKELNEGVSTLAASELLYETAQWNQDEPYNLQCPKDGNDLSVTGCGPTSMAIAMRYYNFPEHGMKASDAYTTESKGIYVESRDLPNHYYDWNNMLLEYGSTWTDAQGEAVATLIADIGSVAQVDYSSTGTGMAVGLGATGQQFYNYFGYSSMMSLIYSTSYSDADWTEIIKNEVATNGPMPYLSALMVHQFIIDGYNSSDYFHINWGWGGYDNGYFLLPDIVEGADEQLAYIDFFPDDGKGLTSLQLSNYNDATGIVADTDVFSQNKPFTMNTIYFFNTGVLDFTGLVAFGLTDSEGNLKELISGQVKFEKLGSLYIGGLNPTSCNISTEIESGDCIRLCYKNDTEDDWHCMLAADSGLSYRIVITEDMIGEPVEYEYSLLMYDTGLTTTATEFATNASFEIKATIINFSKEIDLCYLNIALCDSNGDMKEWICNEWSNNFPEGSGYNYTKSCVINGDIEPNDRIRVFYQVGNNIEGQWKLVEADGDAPWEIVISEDQIGEPAAPESEYSISVYGDGLTTSTSVFIPDVAFTAYATFADWTSDIDEVHLIVALTDSEGNVKEYISDDTNIGKVQAMYVWNSGNISCTITGEITAGDRIRMYYQANNSGYWYWFNDYYDVPREIVITEDMIGAQFYDETSSLYLISVQGSKDVEVTWGGTSSDSGTEAYAGAITIPATVTYSGTTYNVVGIGDNAFHGCTLTSVSIPNSVTYLGERAFQNCDGITEITIPESVISIGNYSFFDCNNLQTVVIGDGVEDLGIYTFQNCNNMTSLTLGNKLSSIREYVFSSCSSLPTVDLPNSVTSLGNDALANCSALATISFGSGMQSLGSDVFDGSNAITTITVATDNQYFSAVDNVLFNKDQTRLVLYPSGAEVTEYAIPEGVTTIADHAFKGSTKLTALTFPESLTTLENYSIEGCTGVSQMTLSTNVTTIGEGAFYGCSGLGTLNILNPTPPSFASRVFEGGPNATVCVPAGTLAEYTRVWGEASNITGLSAYNELSYAVLKIGSTSYATYYNEDYDIDLTDTGIKAYWAESIEDEDGKNVVTLMNIGNTIPAKTAVVFNGAQTDLTKAPATASSAESTYTSNMLHGQSTTGTIPTEEGYLYYILSANTSGEVGFFYGASDGGAFVSTANKAWLAVPSGMANSLSVKFKDEDDTTGISSVGANYGEGDGNIYTIQGIRVNDMSRPGVYIVNGKKILVK